MYPLEFPFFFFLNYSLCFLNLHLNIYTNWNFMLVLHILYLGFPGGSAVKNLPAIQETWVQSLGQEDPLEKGMALHSSILAWSIPWREEPGRLQSMGLQRLGHNWATEHPPIQEALGLLHYKSQHKRIPRSSNLQATVKSKWLRL